MAEKRTTYADGAIVYTSGVYGNKLVVDFDAIKETGKTIEHEAYVRGFNKGRESAENAAGQTENLAQIDRMARQIEEAHAALRRRNAEIVSLNERLVKATHDLTTAKLQTEREARAEAWHEGWKHDAEYQSAFGQYCRDCKCNPYADKGDC